MNKLLRYTILAGLCFSSAHAVLTINVDEIGGNVVFVGAGTLDVTSATPTGPGLVLPFETYMDPDASMFYNNPNAAMTNFDGYTLNLFNFGYGAGGLQGFNEPAAISTGTDFGIFTTEVFVPTGFMSGAINFTTTIFATNFATLGITPGTYDWAFPGDSIQMIVTAGAIPEPSTYMAILGFIGLGVLVWRRRRKAIRSAERLTS